MTFALHAFLPDAVPAMSNASLADDLARCFSHDERLVMEFERLPLSDNDTLALRWDAWMVRMIYEEGDQVIADALAKRRRLLLLRVKSGRSAGAFAWCSALTTPGGTSKNLLRGAICVKRCSPYLRTAALLERNLRRSRRFFEVPQGIHRKRPADPPMNS